MLIDLVRGGSSSGQPTSTNSGSTQSSEIENGGSATSGSSTQDRTTSSENQSQSPSSTSAGSATASPSKTSSSPPSSDAAPITPVRFDAPVTGFGFAGSIDGPTDPAPDRFAPDARARALAVQAELQIKWMIETLADVEAVDLLGDEAETSDDQASDNSGSSAVSQAKDAYAENATGLGNGTETLSSASAAA